MSNPLRPLLPRVLAGANNDTTAFHHASSSHSNPPVSSRQRQTPAACGACRSRKTKCSGERPACSLCARQGRGAECVYETNPAETRQQALKRKYGATDQTNNVYRELFDVIRTRPMGEVTDIIDRLRSGASVGDLMRHIESGDLLLQLAVAPETRYRHHTGSAIVIPDLLKTANNPYTASLVYRTKFDTEPSPSLGLPDSQAMYDAPYHAAHIVNVDIDTSKPSMWTNASTDDQLLRDILRSYFTSVYDFLPFFHKDYFLQDMARGKRRFCSSLLVNSVLAAGCRAYPRLPDRSHFWNPSLLHYRFLAEARRLRELSTCERSITRVQADMVLHLEHGMNAQDKTGWSLCVEAVTIAQGIGLFDDHLPSTSKAHRIVRATTAWALFAWQGLQSYHQEKPPLLPEAPNVALPSDPVAFGDIWVKYPTGSVPVQLHFSQTFRVMIEFRTIMNDIANFANSASASKGYIPLAQATVYHSRLQQWYERLPDYLSPQKLIFPAHFHVHMHYWLVVARLFEPLMADEETDSPLAPQPPESSPMEIVAHAKTCIRTLVRLYFGSHGGDGYDLFSVLIAQYVGFSTLGSILASEQSSNAVAREVDVSDTLVCAQILFGQSRMAYLSGVVLQVLHKSVPAEISSKISCFINVSDTREKASDIATRQVQAEWPIYIVAPVRSIDDRRLGNLFRAIAELSASDDGDDHSSADGA